MENRKDSRRRFLTGSAAIPVVLTVQSGSALAATSSMCRQRDKNATTPTLLPTDSNQVIDQIGPDEWLRVDVQLVTIVFNGVQYASGGTAVKLFKTLDGEYYYKYLGSTTTPTLLNGPSDPRPPGKVVGQNVVETNVSNGVKSALVQINLDTLQQGYFWQSGISGQKLTRSCWTSFKP